jgi:hypothetical protein
LTDYDIVDEVGQLKIQNDYVFKNMVDSVTLDNNILDLVKNKENRKILSSMTILDTNILEQVKMKENRLTQQINEEI